MLQLRRRFALMVASALLLMATAIATAPAASAKAGDVITTGSCSGAAHWKLKLSPENGRIAVEFEVDTNRVGKTWAVKIKRNGNVLASGLRVTTAPSGSFVFRTTVSNLAGPDTIVGRAVSLSSGQLCRGVATF